MGVHITNIHGFVKDEELKIQQNTYADAGKMLGFLEMGIFAFDVHTDTDGELSKRIDGIISSLKMHDVVFLQLPTSNGVKYDWLLINKLNAYNTKIVVLLHENVDASYLSMIDKSVLIMPTKRSVNSYLRSHGFMRILYEDHIHYSFPLEMKTSTILDHNFYRKKYLMDALDQLYQPQIESNVDIIHIGFGLHDRDGHYSAWVGTTMQSIIDHTDAKVCFHVLHDESLSIDNKNKLEQVVHSADDYIEFHSIDTSLFMNVKEQLHRFTIGTMFRCVLPEILPDLRKIIYLDADLFVNRDIKELWDINIEEYCLAAIKDEGSSETVYSHILDKYTDCDKRRYFNAGVLSMNLDNIRKKGNLTNLVVEFLKENPDAQLFDQDALNVIFKDSTLLIDKSWNRFAGFIREDTKEMLPAYIYHYAANYLLLYSESKMDIEYFKTICKTPWADYEIENQIARGVGRLKDRIHQYENMLPKLSVPGVKHIFYGEENDMLQKLYKSIHLGPDDYRVLKNPDGNPSEILPCKNLDTLKEEKGPLIIFVLYESDQFTAIENLEKMGFVNEKDFFVVARFFSYLDRGFA